MKSAITQPTHITTGNVFDDLGFAPSKALELKIKADLWLAIRDQIESAGHTQRDLCRILDEYQPEISNLLRGRISSMSIEKLLRYAGRLNMQASLKLSVPRPRRPRKAAKAA
jgi:predicted XRE-type DNA-binding protein